MIVLWKWCDSWKVTVVFLISLSCQVLLAVGAVDNLALLDGTLRTFQQAACDGEVLDLQCPAGTAVNIQIAQFGRASPEVEICNHHMALVIPSVPREHPVCNVTSSMQYALLHMVAESCSKKRSCSIPTAAESLSKSVVDPCPTVPKFVEIAYKCRPNEFRSKIACEGESLPLKCNTSERIAIFSASYGRPQEDKYHCPQTNGLAEEVCQSSLSTEAAMKLCHGKVTCSLEAKAAVFGNASCNPKTRKYLRVIFTCVPRKILKDQYTTELDGEDTTDELKAVRPIGPEEVSNRVTTEASRRIDDFGIRGTYEKQGHSEPAESSPYEPGEQGDFLQTNEDLHVIDGDTEEGKGIVDIISEWIGHYSKEGNDKLIIYLTLGIAASIVAFLGILVARLWYRRRKAKASSASSKQDTISTNVSIPGFNGEVEDVDTEIDLTLVPPQEFYTGDSEIVGTVRRDTRRESSFQGSGYSSFSKSFDSGGTVRRDQVTMPRSMTYNTTSLYYD